MARAPEYFVSKILKVEKIIIMLLYAIRLARSFNIAIIIIVITYTILLQHSTKIVFETTKKS